MPACLSLSLSLTLSLCGSRVSSARPFVLWEAGTPAFAEAVALGAACEQLGEGPRAPVSDMGVSENRGA